MAKPPGYKGKLYVGTAGSTAGTEVTTIEDLQYDTEAEKVETTVRGDGSAAPIVTEVVVAIKPTITFSMFEKSDDANLTTFRAAARTGAAIALRTKAHSSGLGFDGDAVLSVTHEMTLKGASKYNFTATANDELRAVQLNV
jgi:hypothetical protein